MTATVTDHAFMTDGRPYLNARQAAEYVGYQPKPRTAGYVDSEMKAFYVWCSRHGVRQLPSGGLYARADLDAAVRGEPAPSLGLDRIRAMVKADMKRGPKPVGRRRAS